MHNDSLILYNDGTLKTVLMDSISYVSADNRGDIIVSGSHGGSSSAGYALEARVGAAFFNDAGIGKNGSGIRGLELLGAEGIIAMAVSNETAEIANAADTYENGIVSRVNDPAKTAGVLPGSTVAGAVNRLRSYLRSDR